MSVLAFLPRRGHERHSRDAATPSFRPVTGRLRLAGARLDLAVQLFPCLKGGALNRGIGPITDRCHRDLISVVEFCENRACHAIRLSRTAVACERHVHLPDFTCNASKRLEHAVVGVRLRAPVSGVPVIRVLDFHRPPRTAQDLGRCPCRRTMRMSLDGPDLLRSCGFRNESSTSDRNSLDVTRVAITAISHGSLNCR